MSFNLLDASQLINENSDDIDEFGISEIESLCLNCYEQGQTKILPTSIPFFRKVVLMSFRCEHCNYSNSEIQDFADLSPKGVRFTVSCNSLKDLNRQVIKASNASITIPEVQFEIPSITQRGDINTIEGFVIKAADGLNSGQTERAVIDSKTTAKIQEVIDRLYKFARGEEKFTFILDDPSGNSFVQNPEAPKTDSNSKIEYYERTREQLKNCGYQSNDDDHEGANNDVDKNIKGRSSNKGTRVSKGALKKLNLVPGDLDKAATITGSCYGCGGENETRMCFTNIPNFKEIIIMVTDCDICGFRDVEIKPSGPISSKGCRAILQVSSPNDLKRDLLKSDSAGIKIPEINFEMVAGSLGGKYTTVEGILANIYDQLSSTFQFQTGDSALPEEKDNLDSFLAKFKKLSLCETPFTLILDDPLGNVFIGHIDSDKFGPDPQVTVEQYTRTFEENEEFGLNDIKTENYENSEIS